MEHDARRGAPSSSRTRSTSSCASRSWMTSALPCALGQLDVPAERLLLHGAAAPSPVRKKSRPVSPIARTRGSARERVDLGERVVERARRLARRAAAPRSGAARRRPRRRRASRATSTDQRAPGRSQPICTIRVDADRRGRGRAPRRRPSQLVAVARCRGGSGCRRPGPQRLRARRAAASRVRRRGRRARRAGHGVARSGSSRRGNSDAPLVTVAPGRQLAPAAGVLRRAGRRAARAAASAPSERPQRCGAPSASPG